MSFEHLITRFGIYLGTYIVCLVSGFVPFVNAEVYLIMVSAIAPKGAVIPIILISTVGQMTAKCLIYLGGRGILKLPIKRYQNRMEKTIQKFKKWENKTGIFIFLSALTGVPQFYIVSFMAGILKLNFERFLIFGFLGRLLRFAATVLFPQLIRGTLL